MKKLFIITLCISFSFVLLGANVHAEMAKEGSGYYRSAKHVTFEVLAMGKEQRQLNTSQLGMVVDAPENSPFENATFKTIGTLHTIGKSYKGSGFIEFNCANGDKIYATFETEGTLGEKSMTHCPIVGGTGECTGIQGSLELGYGPKVKSSQEGVRQTFSVGTVSWKIP